MKIWLRLIVSLCSSEQEYAAPLEVVKFLEEEIVLATKKFAILFPSISIAIYRIGEEEPFFSTFGLVLASTFAKLLKLTNFICRLIYRKTLQAKVAEFHKISLRDMFVVKTDHGGCETEICFFIAQSEKSEDKTQMLFTTNYFNPVFTESLVMKLAEAEARHEFVELVGFIGKFSDDNYAKVERAVEIVFGIFNKRLEEMARNLRHMDDIGDFISDPVEPLRKKSGPVPVTKPSSERWSFRTRKPAVVDLTFEEKDDNAAFVLTDEVSTSFLHEYACSDILEPPENEDYYDPDLECLIEGWDDQVHKKLFLKGPYNLEFFDDWVLSLEENRFEEHFEDGFVDAMIEDDDPPPAKPRPVPDDSSEGFTPDEPEAPKTPGTAMDYYEQKASGSSTSQRRQVPVTKPKLGRGLDPDQSVELKANPRKHKSKLFDQEEIENYDKSSNSSKPSIVQSLYDKATTSNNQLASDYKIPKKQGRTSSHDQWAPGNSILEKSQYSRAPIHANTNSKFLSDSSSIFKPTRSERSLQRLKLPYASPTDTRPSEMPKFNTKKSSDDDDVIFVDDEAENEPKANDQNNNQKGNRRPLYNPSPAPNDTGRSYKIFTSKREPNFRRHDGAKD